MAILYPDLPNLKILGYAVHTSWLVVAQREKEPLETQGQPPSH